MTKPNVKLPELSSKDIERFWDNVSIGEEFECWIWKGGKFTSGYGRLKVSRRTIRAHRIAYLLSKGNPGEFLVCHNCPTGDNKLCVNPSHLWIGTTDDNMKDAARKGRMPKGDNNFARKHPEKLARGEMVHLAKLSRCDVLEIRSLYSQGKGSQRVLARKFNIHKSTIQAILKRKTWKHI